MVNWKNARKINVFKDKGIRERKKFNGVIYTRAMSLPKRQFEHKGYGKKLVQQFKQSGYLCRIEPVIFYKPKSEKEYYHHLKDKAYIFWTRRK